MKTILRFAQDDKQPAQDDTKPAQDDKQPAQDDTRWLRAIALAALTPLLEKNVIKTLAVDVPLVFSMGRVIVLAFALCMLRQIWRAGIAGWPEATLSIAIVLALPVLGALERVTPDRVVDLASALVGRFGVGSTRSREPSKFDDHRADT
ncbi:MAG: hypothetical protein JWM41_3953 [Gemmatimonadetes bacterium]|nr:hypothetical protein [Gemmatimonadota bacterium]